MSELSQSFVVLALACTLGGVSLLVSSSSAFWRCEGSERGLERVTSTVVLAGPRLIIGIRGLAAYTHARRGDNESITRHRGGSIQSITEEQSSDRGASWAK